MTHIMIKRQDATQKTLAKYRGKVFEWGKNDCIKMARTQLNFMGHKLPMPPRYSSLKTAVKRLKEQGCNSTEELLAKYLAEIPPAMAVLGDIATVKGDADLSATVICLGQGKYAGFFETGEFEILTGFTPERAFRV